MMFCPFCGTNLPDDAMFCRNCGERQPQQTVQNNSVLLGIMLPEAPMGSEQSPLTIASMNRVSTDRDFSPILDNTPVGHDISHSITSTIASSSPPLQRASPAPQAPSLSGDNRLT